MKKEEQKIETKSDDESISIFTLFIIIAIVFLPLSLGFTFITNDENFNNMGKLFGYISYGSFGVVGIILIWRMFIKLYNLSKKIRIDIDMEKITSKIKSIQMDKRKMTYYVMGFLLLGGLIIKTTTNDGIFSSTYVSAKDQNACFIMLKKLANWKIEAVSDIIVRDSTKIMEEDVNCRHKYRYLFGSSVLFYNGFGGASRQKYVCIKNKNNQYKAYITEDLARLQYYSPEKRNPCEQLDYLVDTVDGISESSTWTSF